MDLLVKLLLAMVYPLLVLGRLLNALLGRDPLRVREPDGATCWIERGPQPSRTSYFSEASATEGRDHRGFGRLATAFLGGVAWLFVPRSKRVGEDFRVAADRDKDVPDEVYTLW